MVDRLEEWSALLMYKFKQVTVEMPTEIFCDMCNQSCDVAKHKYNETFPPRYGKDNPASHCEFATLETHFGYWSDDKDMLYHKWELCERCFEKVMELFSTSLLETVQNRDATWGNSKLSAVCHKCVKEEVLSLLNEQEGT